MSPEELERAGRQITGRDRGWKTGVAELLNAEYGGSYRPQRVWEWHKGRVPIPRGVAAFLKLKAQ